MARTSTAPDDLGWWPPSPGYTVRDPDAENEVFKVTARLSGAMTGARIAREDPAALAAEALACRDEADLLARLEARRRRGDA